MNIKDRMALWLLGKYFKKESATYSSLIKSTGGQVQWTPKTFKAFAKEGYKMNVYVYACVNQIAKSFSGVNWYLYQKKQSKNGKDQEIETHPLLDLMNRPNPFMGGTKFREEFMAYLMIAGNAYIERVGPLNGPPKELYVLRPDRIKILPGDSQHLVRQYIYHIDDLETKIDAPYVMHSKMFDPLNDWYGMSPLEAASRSVDQNNESRKWNVEMLQNDCVAPGILETERGLTDIQFNRLENNWRDKYQLKGDKYLEGTPMILEGGLKWTSMGVSPKDMSWLEGSKLSAREIGIAYNVPPELIGDSSNKTYCLPGYTRIMTSKGSVKIENVEVGDEVISLDIERNKMISKKVEWQGEVGTKEVFEIQTHGRTLHATGNHPVLVRESFEIPATHEGKRHSTEKRQRLVWKAVQALKEKDVIVGAHTYSMKEIPTEYTEDQMELFGAMLGDGFSKSYPSGHLVSMSGNKGERRDFYLGVMKLMTACKFQEYEREVRTVSKELYTTLNELGLSGNAFTKRIPQWVFTESKVKKLRFLRGMIDTDGSVDKNGRISYTSVNLDLIKDLRDLCVSLEIPTTNIYTAERGCKLPSGDTKITVLNTINLTCQSINADIGSRDSVRRKTLEQNKNSTWKGRRSASESIQNSIPLLENCEFVRIKSIKPLGKMKVYDITVEDTHGFFADGVYVHNSNYKEARKALYEENVLPLLDWYRDEFNNWLVPLFGSDRLRLNYDVDDIEALQEDRDSIWTRIKDADFLKQNEKRTAVGYDELSEEEGGDLILVGTNQQSLDSLMPSNEPEPTPGEVPPQLAGSNPPKDQQQEQNLEEEEEVTEEQVEKSKAYLRSKKSVKKKSLLEGQEHLRQVNVRRQPYIENAYEIVKKLFDSERKAVVGVIKDDTQESSKVFRMVEQNRKNWEKVIEGIYTTVAEEFAKDTIRAFKSALSGYEVKADMIIPDELLYGEVDIAKEETLKWLEKNSASKVKGITDTTREKLRAELHEGVSKGESIPQLAARIDTLYLTKFMNNRSTVIARTEVISASNLGSRSAALGLNLPGTIKEWLSASDNRVRMWHQAANGQQQDLEEPYTVYGEKMMFPGDSSMGASSVNIVQCRCCEVYELPEGI